MKSMRDALLLAGMALLSLRCGGPGVSESSTAETSAGTSQEYRIDGRIEGAAVDTITLYRDGAYVGFTYDEGVVAEVSEGRFVFTGQLEAPEVFHLEIEGGPKLPLFVEPGAIEVVVNATEPQRIEVTGSRADALLRSFEERRLQYHDEIESLGDQLEVARKADQAATVLRLEKTMEREEQAEDAFLDNWIASHAETFVAPYVAVRHRTASLDLSRLEPLLELFPPELGQSRYLRELESRRELLAAVAIGQRVPEFELPSPSGDVVAIGDFLGKVTLVDFWGAWCGPCRAQNPALIELYERFSRDDFEIVGVSIDFSRDAWLEAIEADGLPWTQMGEARGFDTAPARLFAIRALPSNVLLGRDGTILAKDLEADQLPAVLAALVG